MHDSVGILVFPFLEVSLDLLRVESLKSVWLDLEAFVEVGHVLDVILDCLGSGLLDC